MKFTVLGSTGFIGKHLAASLNIESYEVYAPVRGEVDWMDSVLSKDLGHVFYCIGLTADFRQRPFDTIEAHICLLSKLLKHAQMESLVYLSSTRVYQASDSVDESATLMTEPANSSHLYNLSKLMGESLCLNSGRRTKVVRLSNVYGAAMDSDNFLSSVLTEAASYCSVRFMTSPESSKDYISIKDVVNLLPKIATNGKNKIYNLASGSNTSNAEIASILNSLGVKTSFAENAAQWSFPCINITRLENEFGKPTENLKSDLPNLLNYIRQKV